MYTNNVSLLHVDAACMRSAYGFSKGNAGSKPQLTMFNYCFLETFFCTDSHSTQQSGKFSSDSDILIFFCLVFLQFPDACYITGKKLLTAFCLFDYVALPFVLMTDGLYWSPKLYFNRILITVH